MNYDFNLIKITDDNGHTAVDMQAFFAKYKELEIPLPDAFEKELSRLSQMPYSDDLADKIRDVVKRGYVRASEEDVIHYAVHSMVRSRFNRTERAQAAQHARFKQHILPGQRRLIRGRPTVITEQELREHHASFKEKHAAHMLEVRTLDGRLIDLETFAALPGVPAENHTPNRILDSVANDIPTGITFPRIAGSKVLSQEEVSQVVSGMASVEGDLTIDPTSGNVVITPEGVSLEPDLIHDPGDLALEETDDEEEIDDLPPGIPPPPPPPGGQPHKKNKKFRR